jgi:transposase
MSETQQTQRAAADRDRRQILIPFDPRECISRSDAAKKAGVTSGTISGWCEKYGIGRRIGGQWKISKYQ